MMSRTLSSVGSAHIRMTRGTWTVDIAAPLEGHPVVVYFVDSELVWAVPCTTDLQQISTLEIPHDEAASSRRALLVLKTLAYVRWSGG